MTILIHIGQRQNSSNSYFTSCGKIDFAFKLSECKQELECKFSMSSGAGAGAGVTFLGTGAGVKKVTPITFGSHTNDHVISRLGILVLKSREQKRTEKLASHCFKSKQFSLPQQNRQKLYSMIEKLFSKNSLKNA